MNIKKLTPEYLIEKGFAKTDTTSLDNLYYDDYVHPEYNFIIFFNYFNNGKVTYEVTFDGIEFNNVGKDELTVLLRILPKKKK